MILTTKELYHVSDWVDNRHDAALLGRRPFDPLIESIYAKLLHAHEGLETDDLTLDELTLICNGLSERAGAAWPKRPWEYEAIYAVWQKVHDEYCRRYAENKKASA